MMIDQCIQAKETVADQVPVTLEPNDTCDKCGPGVEALVAVMLKSGKLTFCRHCYRQREAALAPMILGSTE